MSAPHHASSNESSATTEIGQLGRYQLLRKLASGGMASVYLARAAGSAGFEKVVALKRIHPHLADDQHFIDMFLDEARIASRIDHANVCSVFDFGKADGTYYIAMEYLTGEPLSHVAKSMARSAEQLKDPRRAYLVARIIADASEGLHAAHELRGRDGNLVNVVHRDVSPQNLFLTYDGVVKVVDFGIASAADRLQHTLGGELKGKFAYMAPEQARGAKGAMLDRRADVFSLGVVLWELLALKRLFRRDTPAETLLALLSEPIPAPSSERPGLTTAFDAIAQKALARNPDERYPSARELGRDLGKAIGKAGEVIGAVDLAEWLDALVPGTREHSRHDLEAALRGEVSYDPLLMPGETSGSDIIVVEPSNVHPLRAAAPNLLDDAVTRARSSVTPTPAPQPASADVTPSPKRAPVPKALYVGGALALLLGFIGTGLAVGTAVGHLGGTRSASPPPGADAPIPMIPPSRAELPVVRPTSAGTTVRPLGTPGPGGHVRASSATDVATAQAGKTPPVTGAGQRTRPGRRPRDAHAPTTTGNGTATPPSISGEGTLIVSTPGGWANVYDRVGRLLGRTPLRTQLPVGTQTLSLRPFGQPPAIAVSVSITAGDTARVNRPLEE